MSFVPVASLVFVLLTAWAAPAVQAAAAAADADYPTKPVRIIVPFAPGGTNDILARMIIPVEIAKWTKVAIAAGMPRDQ